MGPLPLPCFSVDWKRSEETRKAIDAEVKRLTDQAYQNAKKILKKHEDKLHLLAKHVSLCLVLAVPSPLSSAHRQGDAHR